MHHRYDDKYSLAEFVTNTSLASQLNCLSRLGLDADQVRQRNAISRRDADNLHSTHRFPPRRDL